MLEIRASCQPNIGATQPGSKLNPESNPSLNTLQSMNCADDIWFVATNIDRAWCSAQQTMKLATSNLCWLRSRKSWSDWVHEKSTMMLFMTLNVRSRLRELRSVQSCRSPPGLYPA